MIYKLTKEGLCEVKDCDKEAIALCDNHETQKYFCESHFIQAAKRYIPYAIKRIKKELREFNEINPLCLFLLSGVTAIYSIFF